MMTLENKFGPLERESSQGFFEPSKSQVNQV